MIGPAKAMPQGMCRNAHYAWSLSANSSGWRWRCKECERQRKARADGRIPQQRVEPPASGWEAMQDAFEMWMWDFSGARLVEAVAEQCGVTVNAVEQALRRHPEYVRPN